MRTAKRIADGLLHAENLINEAYEAAGQAEGYADEVDRAKACGAMAVAAASVQSARIWAELLSARETA